MIIFPQPGLGEGTLALNFIADKNKSGHITSRVRNNGVILSPFVSPEETLLLVSKYALAHLYKHTQTLMSAEKKHFSALVVNRMWRKYTFFGSRTD